MLELALQSSGMLWREDAVGQGCSSASHHAHTSPVTLTSFLFIFWGWEGGTEVSSRLLSFSLLFFFSFSPKSSARTMG